MALSTTLQLVSFLSMPGYQVCNCACILNLLNFESRKEKLSSLALFPRSWTLFLQRPGGRFSHSRDFQISGRFKTWIHYGSLLTTITTQYTLNLSVYTGPGHFIGGMVPCSPPDLTTDFAFSKGKLNSKHNPKHALRWS